MIRLINDITYSRCTYSRYTLNSGGVETSWHPRIENKLQRDVPSGQEDELAKLRAEELARAKLLEEETRRKIEAEQTSQTR